jgi:hypothetical protein
MCFWLFTHVINYTSGGKFLANSSVNISSRRAASYPNSAAEHLQALTISGQKKKTGQTLMPRAELDVISIYWSIGFFVHV